MTEHSGAPDMWRLRLVRGAASASGGDWQLYESREALEGDLFPAAVEAEAHAHVRGGVRSERERRWRLFHKWWETNQDDGEDRWHVIRINGVDHLVGGEWVEVKWSILPPVLRLHETGYPSRDVT